MKVHIVDKAEIAKFNEEREKLFATELSLDQLKAILHNMGYCTSGIFIKAITNGVNPPVIKVARGRYVFNPQPVHIDRLQQVWKDYRVNGKNRPAKSVDARELESAINRAIALLKNNGYKVLKPTTQYEEV